MNTGEGTHEKRGSWGFSHLDLTIVPSELAARSTWKVIRDSLGSDHLPIITTLDEKPVIEENWIPRWNLKRADWSTYANKFDTLPA